MDNAFNIPEEHNSSEDASRRTMDLIEEIRADIDFELDDAVTSIVRDLPDEYFQRIDRADQVMHLKGLIASRICQLSSELFLPGQNGSQIAVLGRSNYRGQLATILSQLPSRETKLVGASIYTSKSHDFILDVFEFETDETAHENENFNEETAVRIADSTGNDLAAVRDFLASIRTTALESNNYAKLERYFLAQQSINADEPVAIDVVDNPDDKSISVVIAVYTQDERMAFRLIAEHLAQQSLDIEQAELIVLRLPKAVGEAPETRSDKSVLMMFEIDNPDGQTAIDKSKWISDFSGKLKLHS